VKKSLIFIVLFGTFIVNAFAQTGITTISTNNISGGASTTYLDAGNTYNWALSPNNIQRRITGFSTASGTFAYSSALNGVVKFRRSVGGAVTGNFSLIWSEGTITGTTFTMQAPMPATMENCFDDNIYNKGTDNLFDNASGNRNNIERLDWILSSPYSTSNPDKIGFAVFERGADNAHDGFIIAPILTIDANGDPLTYGAIKRVAIASWGNITTSSISYRILKGNSGTNLITAGTGTQNRGGVFLSLSDLGIAAGTNIYGYSILALDLPAAATSADLVDFTNTTNYPIATNTTDGGIDMISTTGIFVDNSILSNSLINLSGFTNENNNLTWSFTINPADLNSIEIERSENGRDFKKISVVDDYYATKKYIDINTQQNIAVLYYRLKVNYKSGGYAYSNIIKLSGTKVLKAAIFPNPINAFSTLTINAPATGLIKIKIINTAGKLFGIEEFNATKGSNAFALSSFNQLAAGNYFVIISNKEKVLESIKIIKP
jgi:hypothetical protein